MAEKWYDVVIDLKYGDYTRLRRHPRIPFEECFK